ncbi:hypothetical protein [Halocola ammonii]
MKLSTSFLSAILLTFTFLVFTQGQAQVTDRAKEKAERKTNQRVDQKIDNGIDKGLDAIEGLFKKKDKKKKKSDKQEEAQEQSQESNQQQQENAMMGLFGGGDVEVQDEYQFDHSMDMHVQMYDKKGKATDEMEYTMLFSESQSYFGMYGTNQGTSFKMVFDYDNLQMITMPEAQPGAPSYGMVMSLDEGVFESEEGEMESSDITFVETGRTKTINGFSCKEYKLENADDEDYETFVWTTMDSDMEWTSYFQAMSEQQKMKMQMPESYPEGMVVQTVMESTKNDEKTVMTIKNMKKNSNETLSTSGYKFMSMGGKKK